MDKVNILHLSDLHFDIEKTKNISKAAVEKREETIKGLLRSIENIDDMWKPDIIVISGDIGFAGKESDYSEAWNWIQKILKTLKLGSERIILCAGNHDRNLTALNVKGAPQDPLIADNDLEEETIDNMIIPFDNFIKFNKNNNIPPLSFNNRDNYLIGVRELLNLEFIVLNSAWFSLGGDKDEKKMYIGLPHIRNMKISSKIVDESEIIPKSMKIAVLHHPPEWLNQSELDSYENRRPPAYAQLTEICDIILSGHTHSEIIFAPDKKYAKSWLFKVGAIYLKQDYRNNCEILKIDIKRKLIKRLKLYYEPSETKWKKEFDDKTYNIRETKHLNEILEENEKLFALIEKYSNSELGFIKKEYKFMHLFLNDLNNLLDGIFSILKEIFFFNAWKIGLVYYTYNKNSYGYALFPIPLNKNDTLIKSGNKQLWKELVQIGLGFIYYDNNMIMANNPREFARKIIYDQLIKILDNKLLNHQCNLLLAQEFIIAFIDEFSNQLGLEKKFEYSFEEIYNAFFRYFPIWIDEVMKLLILKEKLGIKSINDCYQWKPFIDPAFFEIFLSIEERDSIKKNIEVRIKNNEINIQKFVVGHRDFSFKDFEKFLNYLKNNNINSIIRPYMKKGYTGVKKSHYIYEEYSTNDIKSNVMKFFNNFPEVYMDLIKKNFPILIKDFDFFKGASKIIVIFDIKDRFDDMFSPLSIDLFYLKNVNDKSKSIEILSKNSPESKNFDNKNQFDKVIYKGKEYEIIDGFCSRFNTIFEETPMLNYCYELIRNFLDDYFSETLEWYESMINQLISKVRSNGDSENEKISNKKKNNKKKKIIIEGILEKNVLDLKKNVSILTIRAANAKYKVIIDTKKCGMLQVGELIKITDYIKLYKLE